ncbi:MAG: endopeptidase La [Erysipelotrichaceae bacterium]|jgi:ATP-dependent Lon protease|nr:endopeptidase La [Erysipelotrichaceae bacterium]
MGKVKTLTLPLIITRGMIVFPGNQKLVEAGRKFSINAVNQARSDSLLFLTAQKNAAVENPGADDIYNIGTLCRILSITERENAVKVRIEVIERVKFEDVHYDDATRTFIATGRTLDNPENNDPEVESAYLDAITSTLDSLPSVVANMPKALINQISKSEDLISVLYSLAAFVDASASQKQELLEINDTPTLFTAVMNLVKGEETKSKIESDINEAVRKQSDKAQKEYFLREKLKAIKKELGENTDDNSSPDAVLEKLEKEPYPENVKKKVKSELKKFEMMPQGSLEAALIQSYVDVLMNIPWYQKTEDDNDLTNVERILDEDHYGLETPKKRIVEYLAVKKLTGNLKSPILCFYGPPGTGKTSLGKSIARALGRKFFKCSLGGISDEAEIRGHRRTYVGSMPGRIIQGMRKAGVSNPVFLLDEVDKLASSYKGDPASALLEVLDPEQNNAFNDNYVEEPYDLSDVLFICTANYLENVPGPLRDRLELIELSSYTELEKLQIAKNHLVKKQTEINGLTLEQAAFDDDAIMYIIQRYTRESGVRELERKISSCLRKVAVSIVKDSSIEHVQITIDKVREYLGVEIFDNSKKEAEKQIGVVTGLAYTQFGGDILPIEVNYFKGKGGLVLTGKLGDVMKESASIALDYVKANAEKFKVDPDIFANNDIHIHVPEGAVPKDGPSAGVAITCAIISCLSGRPVNPDVAMTGEVTLRGNALPIGGLREKSLAALRSGIKTIIVPYDNKKDVEELPQEVKDNLKIVYMKKVEDAIAVCLTE